VSPARVFARRHEIPPWTFWYWCRRLSTGAVAAPRTTATFVPVEIADDGSEPVIDIVLRGGDRLQVRAGASAELVRAEHALRAAC
jgi:hypothetical protein